MKASKTQLNRILELEHDEIAINSLIKATMGNLRWQLSEVSRLRRKVWIELTEQFDLDVNEIWAVNHTTGVISPNPKRDKMRFNDDVDDKD